MNFICITSMSGNNEDTLINVAEIAAIKEFYDNEAEEMKCEIYLKNGISFIVPEIATDIYKAMQEADNSVGDVVTV